jgi:hypothetical protein
MSFSEDHKYGKEQEQLMFPVLKRFFGKLLVHNQDDFAPFDFEDPTLAVEMKSRKFCSSEYNTVMIKTLKITHCENESRECFLVFNFLDKLCYIQYDKEKFSKYVKRNMLIKNRTDYTEKWEYRTFIPIGDLKTLKTFCMIE